MEFLSIASGSSGNCYLVNDGETALLLEAGIPVRRIMRGTGFSLSRISGCLVTHCHGDHSKAGKELARLGVDVYASSGTMEACGWAGHRFKRVKALEELPIGSFQVLPFDVEHDAPEPLGFLLTSRRTGEKLLYITDTYFIRYKFTGLNIIAAECNYTRDALRRGIADGITPLERVPRLVRSHMSLEHLMDLLRANDLSGLRKIYLLHLSDSNSDENQMRTEIERLTGVEVSVC